MKGTSPPVMSLQRLPKLIRIRVSSRLGLEADHGSSKQGPKGCEAVQSAKRADASWQPERSAGWLQGIHGPEVAFLSLWGNVP